MLERGEEGVLGCQGGERVVKVRCSWSILERKLEMGLVTVRGKVCVC